MLAALRIIKARQRSRLIWIRCGDANTKLFQLRANSRRRKNFIAHLNVQGRTVTQHDDKATTLLHHFQSLLGTYSTRTASINWDSLPLPTHDLHSLDDPLTEAEIQNIIMQLPTEKAPGPDRFTCLFFQESLEHHQRGCVGCTTADVCLTNRKARPTKYLHTLSYSQRRREQAMQLNTDPSASFTAWRSCSLKSWQTDCHPC
jgi:hypothetical protein